MKDWKFHCAVLEVSEDASAKEVRKAYRRLALERHPDLHNGSQDAHEAFQQLSESYNYIIAALVDGNRPVSEKPAPDFGGHKAATSGLSKRSAPSSPTAYSEGGAPRGPLPKKNFKRVWIHAGVACAILLVVSIFFERQGSMAPAHNRNYKPDLFPKAWCFVKFNDGTKEVQEVAELWSQRVCEEKCTSIASNKDVSCEWSGDEFRRSKLAKSTPATPVTAPGPIAAPTASCEITVEKLNGSSLSTPYRNQTENTCRIFCNEMMREKSRDGVTCVWNGGELARQELTRPKQDAPAQPSQGGNWTFKNKTTQMDSPVVALPESAVPAADNGPTGACWMSVVSSEGTFAEPIYGHTRESCDKICIAQIYKNPTGSEVTCDYGGRRIITYVPDPLNSHLAREPSSGFQQGNIFMASCEIIGRAGGKRTLARSDVKSEDECKTSCQIEFLKTPKGTEVLCSFNGSGFFQNTSKQ